MEEINDNSIEFKHLWRVFTKHYKIIIIVTLVSTIFALFYSTFAVERKYSSKARVFLNSTRETENAGQDYNVILGAQKMVDNCKIFYMDQEVFTALEEDLGGKYSAGQLRKSVSVSSVGSSQIIEITAVTTNPEDSALIANRMAVVGRDYIVKFVKNYDLTPYGVAKASSTPSSPDVRKNVLIGFLIGFLSSYIILFMIDFLDKKVKASDDLTEMYDIPVLADILDFEAKVKGVGYKYEADQ